MQTIIPPKTSICVNFVSTILNDAITAIDLFDNHILIGTIMGNVYYSNISNQSFISLIKLSPENISGVLFETKDKAIISIGDLEILRFNLNPRDSLMQIGSKIRIYPNENEHINYCDKCFCFLTPSAFFKINIDFGESTDPIEFTSYSYEYRSLKTGEISIGLIEMTNYCVPFDFDGDRFAWTENTNPTTRRLCVYSIISKQFLMRYTIPKSLGHISYVKLLPNNKLFIVRNRRICEIRTIDELFYKENEFEHIGDEVIAVDVYIKSNHHTNEYNLINVNVNLNNTQRSSDVLLKLNHKEQLILKDSDRNGLPQTLNPHEEKIIEDSIYIATLDYDGNFNVFNRNFEEKLFNLYDINNIKNEFKQKEFFSIGYAYYIKFNLNYYVISTDHGVFAIKIKRNSNH